DLYALERVGIFLDLKTIGGVDWYRMGARKLLTREVSNSLVEQCFALLFLSKGFAPIAIAKWRWNGDWNNDHSDVKNWVAHAGRELDRKLDWAPSRLDGEAPDAAKASMIFVNGHQPFRASEAELDFLRRFLDNHGTLVGEACCNAKAFASSFRKIMTTRLYPDRKMRFSRIKKSHPITHSVHRLNPEEIGVYELKGPDCRKGRVLFLAREISCALNHEEHAIHDLPMAEKIAVNILAWTLGVRDATRKLDTPKLKRVDPLIDLDPRDLKVARDGPGFIQPLGRLKHRGDWSTDPDYGINLNRLLAPHPELPRFDGEIHVHPLSADLAHTAALFINGHEAPSLEPEESVNLRAYIAGGGFVFSSACCSSPDFDAGFRQMMRETLPNDSLAAVPKNDPIWTSHFDLPDTRVTGTEAYRRQFGQNWAPLYGIQRDGRWAVVYSPTDFCCGLEGDDEEDTVCYKKTSAFRLSANILHHALTQWK
ncbi:MAG: DUF4159 domain-containing protein, partial [Verrucomicrobiota bacterium]